MNRRAASWLAWTLAGLSVALFAASVVLWMLVRSAPVPASWGIDYATSDLALSAPYLAFPLVGALISSRRPRNPIGWLLLAVGLLWMLIFMSDYYSVYGVVRPGSVPFPVGMAGINNWLWVPAVGLPATYLFLLFPDGRLPSERWRLLAWLSGAVISLASAGVALSPGPLDYLVGVRNPFGLESYPWIATAAFAALPLLPFCMLLSALSLVLRFRRSGGEARQQIKWIAFAAAMVGLAYLIAMFASLAFPSGGWFAPGSPLWLDLISYVALLSFTLVPVAVGFAVLRYRLYDIDVIINRALVYGLLTATLVLVYAGCVVSLQYAFRTLAGGSSQLAIVASTLAIAALFSPLRRRIQGAVDRRFYRQRYDAAKTLQEFSAKLRDETDLDGLDTNVVSVVGETVQPQHVSLWLRRPDDGRGV